MRPTRVYEASRASELEQPRWVWWLCGAVLITAILVIASMLSPRIHHELALSLSRQNEPYTQLAFNQAQVLPVTVVSGQKVRVSFAVTNDEGKSMSYQYVVASGSGTKLQSLSSSVGVVAAGATWNVNSTVVPKCETATCRVQVSLPQQGEKIDFIFIYQK